MAALLQTDATGLNEYAKDYKDIYPGLQAEIKRLTEENQKLLEKLNEVPTETTSEDS